MVDALVSHAELVQNAKKKQQESAAESKILVEQLRKTLRVLIQANSTGKGANALPLLDKITTIHELDREIDRQLNEDIGVGFEELMDAKSRLQRLIARSNKRLQYDRERTIVDEMQRRAELIDQELRILELTMKEAGKTTDIG